MGRGELFSLGAAATWAIGVIAYKRLGETMPPRTLNLFKNALVLSLLIPAGLLVEGSQWRSLRLDEVALCLLSGFIGIGIADTLYFRGLNALGAGRMGVIGNLYSPMMIVLAYLVLGDRLDLRQILGFALVASGVMTVSFPDAAGESVRISPRHAMAAVLSILLMALSVIMVKRLLESHSVWWISTLRVAGGVGGLLALAALQRMRRVPAAPIGKMTTRRWALLIAAALIGQFLSMLLWLAGYKYTTASMAAILNETASVFIVLFAWLLLGEAITRRRWIGLSLALLGVLCMLYPPA